MCRGEQPRHTIVRLGEELGRSRGIWGIQSHAEAGGVHVVRADGEGSRDEIDAAKRQQHLRPACARLRDRTARTHREVDDRRVRGVHGHGRHDDGHHRREGVQASAPERREPLMDMAGG